MQQRPQSWVIMVELGDGNRFIINCNDTSDASRQAQPPCRSLLPAYNMFCSQIIIIYPINNMLIILTWQCPNHHLLLKCPSRRHLHRLLLPVPAAACHTQPLGQSHQH